MPADENTADHDHPLEDAMRAAEGWVPLKPPYDMPRVPPATEELVNAGSLSPRSKLLVDAELAISGDRQRDYGPVLPGFERIAAMWSAILGIEVTAEQYAMCQVATKLGRLAETPNHRDSWLDVAGYAALGAEVAATEGRYV